MVKFNRPIRMRMRDGLRLCVVLGSVFAMFFGCLSNGFAMHYPVTGEEYRYRIATFTTPKQTEQAGKEAAQLAIKRVFAKQFQNQVLQVKKCVGR